MTHASTSPTRGGTHPFRSLSRRRRPGARSSARHRPSFDPLEGRTLLSAGDLDPTFGEGGYVLTDFGNSNDRVRDVAIQDDGKIIAVGESRNIGPSGKNYIGIVRYNTDGTLDAGFGQDGVVRTTLARYGSQAQAVAVQPDGKIIIAAYNLERRIVLARFDTNGKLDRSFAESGTTTPSGSDWNYAFPRDVLIAPDGSIIVAGYVERSTSPVGDALIARFTPDGSLDPTFDGDGLATIDSGGYEFARAATLAPDGSILLAGQASNNEGGPSPFLARLLPNGQLDPSFDGDGRLHLGFLGDAWGVEVMPDESIVIGGNNVSDELVTPYVARFLSDGSFDQSFGDGGLVITRSPALDPYVYDTEALGLAVQDDGRILIVGDRRGEETNMYVARYETTGVLDDTFGTDGISVVDLVGASVGQAEAMAIQPSDGKIVVGGYGFFTDGTGAGFMVARLEAGSPMPQPGVTVSPTTGLETTEAGGTATIDVVLDTQPAAGTTVTVPISTGDGSEGLVSTGLEPIGMSLDLVFDESNWDVPQAVTVTGQDDPDPDGDIAYAILVGPATSTDPDYDGLDPEDVAVTNLDDEVPPPTFSIDDVTVTEGDSGTTLATFTVSRSGDTSGSSAVDFLTADGTADAGSDYTAAGGTLTFLAGEAIQTVTVGVLGDTDVEPDETFLVDLSNAVGATIADARGQGTITNDDATSIQMTAISPDSVPKGSSVSVTITGAAFVAGATVTFENGSGPAPSASDVVVVDASTMTATITAPGGGPKRDGVWDVRVTNPDGSSAVLAQGFTVTAGGNLMAASEPGPGSDADPLYPWQLRFALRSAMKSWRDAGADLSRLGPLDIRVADLPDATLGQADGSTITLDRDAAGHGWFFNLDPGEDSDLPEGRMDLITAVAHEIGHALGHDHDHEDDVMGELLDLGVRRLPGEQARDIASSRLR